MCGGDTRQGRRRAVYVQGRRPLCGWVTPGGAASDSSGLGREMGQVEVVTCAGFKGREESTLPELKRCWEMMQRQVLSGCLWGQGGRTCVGHLEGVRCVCLKGHEESRWEMM